MVDGQDALLAQMRRGDVQYCVLALLASEERYGFDLVRDLASVDGMVTSEGTIYPLLSRLHKNGLVEVRRSARRPPGLPRGATRLTDTGRRLYGDFRREWGRFRDAVDTLVEGRQPNDVEGR